MLILMGHIHIAPADVAAFERAVSEIGSQTATHAGCLFYAITCQDRSSGRFLVAERWLDQASLAAHLEQPETLAFLATWEARMTADLQTYEVSMPGHSCCQRRAGA